jgi:hypothetical protein
MLRLLSWRNIRRLLKFGVPALVLLLVGLTLHASMFPWSVAQGILAAHARQPAVLIGVGYSYSNGVGQRSAMYQLLPAKGAPPPRVLSIKASAGQSITTRLEGSWGSFLLMVGVVGATLVVVACIWISDLRMPPDKSPERSRDR